MDKFNVFMEKNKRFIENVNLVGSILNKFVFSIAIAMATIFVSIAANNISKTSNDIANASNSISKQNLDISKEQTSPSLEFDIIEEDGINKYKVTNTKGIVKNFDANLEIRITIRNETKNLSFSSTLFTNNIQSNDNNIWVIDGENISLNMTKYVEDLKTELSDEIVSNNFLIYYDKVITVSYRDYNNKYYTEYYKENRDNKFEYDNNLTNNKGFYSWDRNRASTNTILNKNMENENKIYEDNINYTVDFIKQFSY